MAFSIGLFDRRIKELASMINDPNIDSAKRASLEANRQLIARAREAALQEGIGKPANHISTNVWALSDSELKRRINAGGGSKKIAMIREVADRQQAKLNAGVEVPIATTVGPIKIKTTSGEIEIARSTSERHLAGMFEKELFVESSGQEWMFKPSNDSMAIREHTAHELGRLVGEPVAESYVTKIGGRPGFLQRMFPNSENLTQMSHKKITPQHVEDILKSYVFSTATGNKDLHGGNFLHLKDVDRVIGVDKGLSFSGGLSFYGTLPHMMMERLPYLPNKEEIQGRVLGYAQHIQDFPEKPYKAAIAPIYKDYPKEEAEEHIERFMNMKRNIVRDMQNRMSTYGGLTRMEHDRIIPYVASVGRGSIRTAANDSRVARNLTRHKLAKAAPKAKQVAGMLANAAFGRKR